MLLMLWLLLVRKDFIRLKNFVDLFGLENITALIPIVRATCMRWGLKRIFSVWFRTVLGVGRNCSLESFDYFLFDVQKVVMLKSRELSKLGCPNRLHFWVHSCRGYYGAGNCVLVLVEKCNVLETYQAEEVNILLNTCECLSSHGMIALRMNWWCIW